MSQLNRSFVSKGAAGALALSALLAAGSFFWRPTPARSADPVPTPILKSTMVIHTETDRLVATYDGTEDLEGTKFWLVHVGTQQWAINPAHILAIETVAPDAAKQ